MSRQLPLEIMNIVFNYTRTIDLLNCQRVCRSWYSRARVKFLQGIELNSSRAVELFVAAFDVDSEQQYLMAVKSIRFSRKNSNSPSQQIALNMIAIEKLFFWFPNLENVYVGNVDLITNFNQDLCNAVLLRCPKLKTFEMYVDNRESELLLLDNVRPLVTNIDLSYINDLPAESRTKLDNFDFTFPNLKQLTISNFSNTWNPSGSEFQLYLNDYSLEQLALDMEPILQKMNRYNCEFFVLKVEKLSTETRITHKVSGDLSSSTVVRNGDLKGFRRRYDYLSVRLLIEDLNQVKLTNNFVIMLEDLE